MRIAEMPLLHNQYYTETERNNDIFEIAKLLKVENEYLKVYLKSWKEAKTVIRANKELYAKLREIEKKNLKELNENGKWWNAFIKENIKAKEIP